MLANPADRTNDEIPTPASDWTPEQQIAHMLELCEAQIEAALAESDLALETLMNAFNTFVTTARSFGVLGGRQAADAPDADPVKLAEQTGAIAKQMEAAVVAFQFYDKLTQRMGHVRYSLSSLASFVSDRSQTSERDQWRRLLSTLREQYRTEEERQIFQLMVEGISADEARSKAQKQAPQPLLPACDIELF